MSSHLDTGSSPDTWLDLCLESLHEYFFLVISPPHYECTLQLQKQTVWIFNIDINVTKIKVLIRCVSATIDKKNEATYKITKN